MAYRCSSCGREIKGKPSRMVEVRGFKSKLILCRQCDLKFKKKKLSRCHVGGKGMLK